MCGVPVHAAESYLLTLIRKGFRVAIAEQMEDPAEARKRGAKSVVARDVVRLVTPGTLTEESLLEARRHNFLAAFATVRDDCALAWVDISTGEFRVMPCPEPRLAPELARHAPRELLVPQGARLTEIADTAHLPETEELDGLAQLLVMLEREVAPGLRVAFLRSRPGRDTVTDTDRAWATSLYAAARRASVPCEVVHLATRGAIRPIPTDVVGIR